MSKTYSVEPAAKKCVTEHQTWYNEKLDVEMYIETLWRWGRWNVTLDEGEMIPDNSGTSINVDDLGDDVEFDFVDDDCGNWFELDMEEGDEYDSIMERFENVLDEEGYMGIEDDGWEHIDTQYYIFDKLNVEEVE